MGARVHSDNCDRNFSPRASLIVEQVEQTGIHVMSLVEKGEEVR